MEKERSEKKLHMMMPGHISSMSHVYSEHRVTRNTYLSKIVTIKYQLRTIRGPYPNLAQNQNLRPQLHMYFPGMNYIQHHCNTKEHIGQSRIRIYINNVFANGKKHE